MGGFTLGARGEMTLGVRRQHSIFADLGVMNLMLRYEREVGPSVNAYLLKAQLGWQF